MTLEPFSEGQGYRLYLGDCVEKMRSMLECSVDAICTDPPYFLRFMGRKWDHAPSPSEQQRQHQEWAREALRVLKPGGYLLAFGGTRTVHRLTCAIEDAGFEIRDSITWLYGSGFPKSLSVHKATLKMLQSRYGEQRCTCLDSVDFRDGCSSGHDARCQSGQEVRTTGGPGQVQANQAGNTDLSQHSERCNSTLRELQYANDTQDARPRKVEESVLLQEMRELGTEAPRHGDAALRSGMEEPASRNTQERQGLPVLRKDAEAERASPNGTSQEAIQVRGNESPEQSNSAVRPVPPQDRSDNNTSPGFDTARNQPRELVLDDCAGRRDAVAWVCSWCGLPANEWLESLKPLGTAAKPAHEPIVVARKPLSESSVARNVLSNGCGAINIEASRVDGKRWPANALFSHSPECNGECVDGCPVRELDLQSGTTPRGGKPRTSQRQNGAVYSEMAETVDYQPYEDTMNGGSGASRFFKTFEGEPGFRYVAKASRKERGEGNAHPCVKPLALMRYLVKLVCPPGGVVLDPFAGSGSTLVAAIQEGFEAIGIEQEEEYAKICAARCRAALKPSVVNLATKRATNADTETHERFTGTLF